MLRIVRVYLLKYLASSPLSLQNAALMRTLSTLIQFYSSYSTCQWSFEYRDCVPCRWVGPPPNGLSLGWQLISSDGKAPVLEILRVWSTPFTSITQSHTLTRSGTSWQDPISGLNKFVCKWFIFDKNLCQKRKLLRKTTKKCKNECTTRRLLCNGFFSIGQGRGCLHFKYR